MVNDTEGVHKDPLVYEPELTKPELLAAKLHEFFQSLYADEGVLVQSVTVKWMPGEGGLEVDNVEIEGWQK